MINQPENFETTAKVEFYPSKTASSETPKEVQIEANPSGTFIDKKSIERLIFDDEGKLLLYVSEESFYKVLEKNSLLEEIKDGILNFF